MVPDPSHNFLNDQTTFAKETDQNTRSKNFTFKTKTRGLPKTLLLSTQSKYTVHSLKITSVYYGIRPSMFSRLQKRDL